MGSKEVAQRLDAHKVPPQNIEAEQAVLGAMLLNEKMIPEILEIIDESYFYKDSHKDIFTVIVDLFHNRKNIDIVTVSEGLKKKGRLEDIGGIVYLTNLVDNVPATSNAVSKSFCSQAARNRCSPVWSMLLILHLAGCY